MFRTILIPLLALAGVVFAVVTVVKGSLPPAATPPIIEPPRPPFAVFVAGSGLVEASSENIAVGTPVAGIIEKVLVQVNDDVAAGQPLFTIDARELLAEKGIREASLAVAKEQLARLDAGTRPELIPPARARLTEAKAQLDDAVSQLERAKAMNETRGAMSDEELTRRRFAVNASTARVEQMQADLSLLEAGSWSRDIAVARSQVAQAQASLDALKIELDRRTILSPIAGKVLQRNVRPGEFATTGTGTALVLVGTISPLHVRVDIDEFEAWRVKPNTNAVAFARGNKNITTPLTFVRFEPYVVPKRSLTGASTERVDTRVLQAIYRFDPQGVPIYVGQQVDVYIEAPQGK